MQLSYLRHSIKLPHFGPVSQIIYEKYKDAFRCSGDMLYHYTNLEGFTGIVEGKSFWASDIRFLNDSTEFIHGRQLCLESIESLIGESSNDEVTDFLKDLRVLLMEDPLLWGDVKDSPYYIFVVSFCENGDLLSQWRGYSRGQQGVSLGFKINDLMEVSTQYPNNYFIPNKVIYDDDLKRDIIQDILNIGIRSYRYNSRRWNPNTIKPHLTRMVRGSLYWFLPLFKHPSFRQEEEWRFQFYIFENESSEEKIADVQFRVRDNFLLPYMNLKLYYQQQTECLPLSVVRVGPSATPIVTKDSIEFMLRSRDFSVPVETSSVPFRG